MFQNQKMKLKSKSEYSRILKDYCGKEINKKLKKAKSDSEQIQKN